jgi:hypothetical protein
MSFPTEPPLGCKFELNPFTGKEEWFWEDGRVVQVWWYSFKGNLWHVSYHNLTTQEGWPQSAYYFATEDAARKFWQEQLKSMGGQLFNVKI